MKITMMIAFSFLWCLSFSQESGRNIREEKAFITYIKDSIPVEVSLIYNDNHLPEQYYTHLFTPVCEEGICYTIVIDIYWDLLGNFLKYKLPADSTLTKFDHIKFTKEDHAKMYDILSDTNSLLKFYEAENLIDRNMKIKSNVLKSNGIDAVTGATTASIKDAVVGGAVYSSHTLWHIINGPIADLIVKHTEEKFSDSLLSQMLASGNYHYQYYALNRISATDIKAYLKEIIHLISDGSSYVPFFAIEKLPEEAWRSPIYQGTLINLLAKVDFKMQNELLNKLKEIQLSKSAIQSLSNMLQKLSGQQVLKALEIITYNQTSLSHTSMLTISSMLAHPDSEIGKNVYRLLKSNSKENKDIEKILTKYKNQQP